MSVNNVMFHLLPKCIFAVSGVLVSTQVFPLPGDWSQFIQCTREFAPNKPDAPYGTTVHANRVVEVCYKSAPSNYFSNPQEFGPITASPEPRAAEDIPCEELPSAIANTKTHISELRHQANLLNQSITSGEAALQINTDVTLKLDQQSQALSNQCQIKSSAYDRALQKKIEEFKSICNKLSNEFRAECFDGAVSRAESSLSMVAVNNARETACDISALAQNRVNESVLIGAGLRKDVNNWRDQQKKLRDAIRAEQTKLLQLNTAARQCQ